MLYSNWLLQTFMMEISVSPISVKCYSRIIIEFIPPKLKSLSSYYRISSTSDLSCKTWDYQMSHLNLMHETLLGNYLQRPNWLYVVIVVDCDLFL